MPGGVLGSPGPGSCPHGPRRANLSDSDRNIALRMRSAWRYGAIHGEAAPDYGTTPSRRSPTAARRCSRPPLSANAPRVRHQSGISTPAELAAPACGKTRAQAITRPLSPDGSPRAAWCDLATTRHLVQHILESEHRRPSSECHHLTTRSRAPTSARTTPAKARQTPPDSRRRATSMMHAQQRGKSEPRETAPMCVYNSWRRAGSPLYCLLAMR